MREPLKRIWRIVLGIILATIPVVLGALLIRWIMT